MCLFEDRVSAVGVGECVCCEDRVSAVGVGECVCCEDRISSVGVVAAVRARQFGI